MHQHQKSARETMPKWPAWILFATMAACAYPAVSASTDPEQPVAASVEQPSSLASAVAR
jgi:hypothetical protein